MEMIQHDHIHPQEGMKSAGNCKHIGKYKRLCVDIYVSNNVCFKVHFV